MEAAQLLSLPTSFGAVATVEGGAGTNDTAEEGSCGAVGVFIRLGPQSGSSKTLRWGGKGDGDTCLHCE